MARYTTKMSKQSTQEKQYPALELVAAAYILYTVHKTTTPAPTTTDLLKEVTDEDRNKAKEIIDTVTSFVFMAELTGKRVTDFGRGVATLLTKETAPLFEFRRLKYAPSLAEQFEKRRAEEERMTEFRHTSTGIGTAGQRVSTDIEVVKTNYIVSYNKTIVTGKDEHNNLVSYWTSNDELKEGGKIVGRIKAVAPSNFNGGAIVTQLTHVKRAK